MWRICRHRQGEKDVLRSRGRVDQRCTISPTMKIAPSAKCVTLQRGRFFRDPHRRDAALSRHSLFKDRAILEDAAFIFFQGDILFVRSIT